MARQGAAGLEKGGKVMIYKWKVAGLMPVDAQTAGEELNRIYTKNGALNPADIVDESRPEDAPLHDCFEWRDDVAAEKYREQQAQTIVRAIVAVNEDATKSESVRAFVHVRNTYEPISVVVNDAEKIQEVLQTALRELAAFRRKYETLSELAPVFRAIDELTA